MNIDLLDQANQTDDIYFSEEIRNLIESNLIYFRETTEGYINITPHETIKFDGDLYRLLNEHGINKKYHYLIMRVNGFVSSSDYTGDITFLLYPSISKFEQLVNISLTN